MVKYSVFTLALVAISTDAFVTPSHGVTKGTLSSTSTSLHAFTPPTMIIGPMIRKMREENAKKRMPLATQEEAAYESPGLRVGTTAWKWPPVWPFDSTFFKLKEEIANNQPNIGGMANLLTGQMPQVPVETEEEDEEKFDPLQFWGEEYADATTDLDPEAVEKVQNHYAFYLKDGMSVLELGAAEKSYLPEGLKLSRHVGVGANQKLMDQNPALTESMVVDLNDVVKERDVNSDDLRRLAAEPFDAVIMANTVDYLTGPREVYRSAWELLKPGGVFINIFSTKGAAYSKKFERAQTRMWQDYNDDQHMWVSGAFFQFSAGDGWEELKGFDISPDSAKDALDESPLRFLNQGKENNIYAVQATKAYQEKSIDPDDPEKSFSSMMWMLPTLEVRDKTLLAPRLSRAYKVARDDLEKAALEHNVQTLPTIYESLVKMDTFEFGFNLQSQLAADLVIDPSFKANEEQIVALKQGLGLRTPSEEFWTPVGQNTAAMNAEDKINLLSYIVPRFGSGSAEQEASLEAFVDGMKPTFSAIRTKCPDLSEDDVQLLGTELLASEILIPGRSTREEFAAWVGALTDVEMKDVLKARKRSKEEAKAELAQFRADRKANEEATELAQQKMREQVQKARAERTMIFNPQTGKMEPVEEEKK